MPTEKTLTTHLLGHCQAAPDQSWPISLVADKRGRQWRDAAVLSLSVLSASVCAAALVQNGGFETATATVTSSFSSAGVANWANGGPSSPEGDALVVNWITGGFLFPGVGIAGALPLSPDGGNFVFSDGNFFNSTIKQTLTGLIPGAFYTIRFWQALAQDTEPSVTIPGPVTGNWRVSLGSNSWTSPLMSGNGSTSTFSNWALQSTTLQANNATEVLGFLAFGTGDPPLVFLDGVSVTAVPEPSHLALLLLGGLAVGAMYRHTHWRSAVAGH